MVLAVPWPAPQHRVSAGGRSAWPGAPSFLQEGHWRAPPPLTQTQPGGFQATSSPFPGWDPVLAREWEVESHSLRDYGCCEALGHPSPSPGLCALARTRLMLPAGPPATEVEIAASTGENLTGGRQPALPSSGRLTASQAGSSVGGPHTRNSRPVSPSPQAPSRSNYSRLVAP